MNPGDALLKAVIDSVAQALGRSDSYAFESGADLGPAALQLAIGRLRADSSDHSLAVIPSGSDWDSLTPAWRVRQMKVRVLFDPVSPGPELVLRTAQAGGFTHLLMASTGDSENPNNSRGRGTDFRSLREAFPTLDIRWPLASPTVGALLIGKSEIQRRQLWTMVVDWLSDPQGPWRSLLRSAPSTRNLD